MQVGDIGSFFAVDESGGILRMQPEAVHNPGSRCCTHGFMRACAGHDVGAVERGQGMMWGLLSGGRADRQEWGQTVRGGDWRSGGGGSQSGGGAGIQGEGLALDATVVTSNQTVSHPARHGHCTNGFTTLVLQANLIAVNPLLMAQVKSLRVQLSRPQWLHH